MAQLVGVLNTAHSPFCYMPAERWEVVRSNRPPYRDDVPVDSIETNHEKAARVQAGFAALRARLKELRPDVLIVFGDDQEEQFTFANHPSLAVYVGESFSGRLGQADGMFGQPRPADAPPIPQHEVKGHPGLSVAILTGLMERGFDPAFMTELPNPERGMGHAIMRPLESLTDFSIPTVALLMNAYFAPQVTAERCVEAGRAVRQIVDSYPEDLRVVAIGSGGLWHTPGQQRSYIDEEFDQLTLKYLESGDVAGWARHFDSYHIAEGDASQDTSKRRGSTGLPIPGGPVGGTRETCNWIGATAMSEGTPFTIVDYIPIYASPIGAAFSYSI